LEKNKRKEMNRHVKKQTIEYFNEVIPQFNHIEGDYVELGYGRGTTASIICEGMSKGKFLERDMWLFDSFEGLPEPTIEDDGRRKPKKGQLSYQGFQGFIRVDEMFPNIKKYPVKGFFENTVPDGYGGDKIAILHLDCDLYGSYIKGFELLDKVVPGGLIMFDEFEDYRWPGATKAILERFDRDKLRIFRPDSFHPKCYTVKE
jgi:O-methyltransferase